MALVVESFANAFFFMEASGLGFVGGMLYAILKGWDSDKWAKFGWASGAFVASLLTDYAQPADEDTLLANRILAGATESDDFLSLARTVGDAALFRAHMTKKAKMSEVMRSVPSFCILDDGAALMGLAHLSSHRIGS